jgi:RNA polymerase sigma-70 factor (ECF subfamily)
MLSSGEKPEVEERLLLQRLAKGDETAFAMMIARYRKRVFSHCLSFAVRYEEAEELTQDIFIKIWQHRDALASVDSFADYMFIVSRNHLVSYIRKRVKEEIVTDTAALADELGIPDLQLQARELQEMIDVGIARMPAQQQTVFRLSRQEGLSYEEIAAQLKISRSTVKWHIIAGLNALRQYVHLNGGPEAP